MAWVSFLGCDRAIFLLVGVLTSNKLAHHFELVSLALLLQATVHEARDRLSGTFADSTAVPQCAPEAVTRADWNQIKSATDSQTNPTLETNTNRQVWVIISLVE